MNGSTRGYAAYKVADSVTTREALGLGSYCVFTSDASIVADRAFQLDHQRRRMGRLPVDGCLSALRLAVPAGR